MKMNTDNYQKRVFISYVRDNADKIDLLCKSFQENNIRYWLDHDQINPGELWKVAINDAINKGAYFLACFSKEYKEKTETYMNEEILVAIDILRKKHFNSGWFIPIKLSECEIPPYDIGAGKTLQDIHYLKFYKNWDTEMNRLIDIIKREEDNQPFSNEYFQKEYTYLGLKSLIESGSGAGFHNRDLGHPVYVLGADGITSPGWEYADSLEKNILFKMLSNLSKELKQSGIENRFIWWYDFSEWKDFCKFAIDTYNKRRGYK